MRRLIPPVLFVVTFAAFVPALRGDFVNWDDDVLFLNNYGYRGLGPTQITWMFTHSLLGHFQPITWLTHGLDYCLWGMNPFGYHLTNLLFHSANAVLVYLLAVRVLSIAASDASHSAFHIPHSEFTCRLMAAFAALLFALHPLRVESVAWITERRDLVSTFFLIPAVLCYFRYAVGSGDTLLWCIASIILFAFSLLSKAWGITLPLVLLVLDVYPLRRLRWKSVSAPSAPLREVSLRTVLLEKLPFAVLAYLAASKSAQMQFFTGMATLETHTLSQRIMQASYGLVFYLGKTFLPIRLNHIYEIPIPFNPFASRFLLAAAVLIALVALVVLLRRRLPSLATSSVIYAVILAPVLGFTQTGPQLVADRYSYVACIPFAILAAAGYRALAHRRRSSVETSESSSTNSTFRIRPSASIPAFVILGILSSLTWHQCGIWRNSTTLFEHSYALDPDSCVATNGLGCLRMMDNRFEEAAALFRFCADRRPDNPIYVINVAGALMELKQNEAAKEMLHRALDLRPPNANKLVLIAQGLSDLGDDRRSAEAARLAIDEAPADPRAHFLAGQALARIGDFNAAIPYLMKSIELLEPALQNRDDRSPLRATMFEAACNILADYYEKIHDRDKAADYRNKATLARGF